MNVDWEVEVHGILAQDVSTFVGEPPGCVFG